MDGLAVYRREGPGRPAGRTGFGPGVRPVAFRVMTPGKPAVDPAPARTADSPLPADHPSHRLADSPYLRACRGQRPSRVPVWFQRQAGRSLPEYRALRREGSILDTIADPELSAEITMQPVRRHGVDAAILYSDIVVPLQAIGFGVDVVPGVGPVIDRPFDREADLARLRPVEPGVDLAHVEATVRILAAELDVPLIGFAGAPFTLASYLVEGRPSRTYGRTKALMLDRPELWHRLMDRLADLSIASIRSQVLAGASALQLFDSWAGALSPRDYAEFVAPHSRRIFDELAPLGVPMAHFGVGTGELLTLFAETGATVVGIDWRIPLDEARRRTGGRVVLQGNLDPAACMASWPTVAQRVRRVLGDNGGHPGFVFNLGHGVLPETDPGILSRIVELVHEEGSATTAD